MNTKKVVYSSNKDIILGVAGGFFFIGFNLLIYLTVTKTIDTLMMISFIVLIILLNVLRSLKRVTFLEDFMVIKGDLGISEKWQHRHVLRYEDIDFAILGQLNVDEDSAHEKSTLTQTKQIFMNSGYSVTKCITFHKIDGSKVSLIVNFYTIKQIILIIDELIKKGVNIQNIEIRDTFLNHHSNNPDESSKGKVLMYPPILGIITIIGFLMFFSFVYMSSVHGGSPNNVGAESYYDGYIVGNYYLNNHGEYTEVSADIYEMMVILQVSMYVSFLIMFIGNILYGLKWNKTIKNRNAGSF